jgi:predicted permease
MRYGVRTLRRDIGFTTFAILIVGLGVGASATVFSLVNGVLLRPMPFKDPSSLIWISNIADDGKAEWRLQVANLVDLGARSKSLSDFAGFYTFFRKGNAVLTGNGESERLTRAPVTCNFLPFLGVRPMLGRSFTDDECLDNSSPVVILTESFWRTHLASDPAIVGRTVTINDAPATVIGVVPASFDFTSVFMPGTHIDMFGPFPLTAQTSSQGNTLAAIGRLKPGVSVNGARTELVDLGKRITAEFPRRNTIRPKIMALDERVNGSVRPALFVLAIAVAALMLIVCANLASLQFARMMSRQREMAVRLALGAGRRRLIRQTLTESLILAGVGALLGLAITIVGTRLVAGLSAFDIPLLSRVHVDGAVLGVAALVAIGTGVFVGVLPALGAPTDVHDALKDGNRGASHGSRHARVQSTLVVTEIAAACVLVVASTLLYRSFINVLSVDLGYRPEHVFSLRVDPAKRFPDISSANTFYDDVERRARSIPGVVTASLTDVLPFAGERSWGVAGEGQVYQRGQYPEAFVRVVSDGYFGAMSIPILKGRDFTAGDSPNAPDVVIVNEILAKTLWPNADAIGQVLMRGARRLQVVGVVGGARHDALEGQFSSEVYYPMRQPGDYASMNLVIRTNLPETQLALAVRTALASIAPDASKQEWRTLQSFIDKVASPRRFVVTLLGGFTAFALILAALGIYALVSYGVNQRTQEIGIRLALGASANEVSASIMRGTLVLAATGTLIGLLAAVLLAPSLSGMLFGVTWRDPASFGAALVLIVLVAAAAGHFPARRASRVDPSIALRG